MKTQLLTYLLGTLTTVVALVEDKCSRPPDEGLTCTYFAFAKDYSGLDGCGMMFLLPDGSRLLPTNLDSFSTSLKSGDAVYIDYTRANNTVSICMAEKSIVRLNCLRMLRSSGDSDKQMIDPYRVPWAERVMQEIDPRIVESVSVDNVDGYRFTSRGEIRIYAWDGSLICAYKPRDQNPCGEIVSRIRNPRIIYTVNEGDK